MNIPNEYIAKTEDVADQVCMKNILFVPPKLDNNSFALFLGRYLICDMF